MTPEELKIYKRNWMRAKRANKTRFCPDCGARELDKGFRFCAECAEARLYIRRVIIDHDRKKKDPEKYKERYTKWNLKRDRRKAG